MERTCYRMLTGYKYQLTADTGCETGLRVGDVGNDFVQLDGEGRLTLRAGYAWDGPSGPTLDTPSFMRGSLLHDALYQLMRTGLLDPTHRESADRLLRQQCLDDGMPAWRVAYVYRLVRWFGGRHATPRAAEHSSVTCLP